MKKITVVFLLYLIPLLALNGCGNKESANQLSNRTTADINVIESQADAAVDNEENEYTEIDISDICDLTEAKLTGNGKEFICNDEKALETLENIFQTSKSITETGCPFNECALYIEKTDGTTGIAYLATDDCNVIKTSSGCYTYGDEIAGSDNSSKFWALFDIGDPHATFGKS